MAPPKEKDVNESGSGLDVTHTAASDTRSGNPASSVEATSNTPSENALNAIDLEKAESSRPTYEPTTLRKVISRTISRTSVTINPGPPPDGGFDAWSQVIFTHLVIFVTWGYINSYGVFQNYYVQTLNHPPSDIAWIGSTQIFLLFFVGTFSGRATDGGYFRHVLLLGSVIQLIGLFMTSLSTEYWQLFLAQGICTGLGNGILFCPTIALIPTYFDKKRAIALAIVSSGSSTGGMVFPGIIEALLPKIGFAWTVRVLAFITLGIQAAGLIFLKPRLPPRRTGPLIELSAFRELPYSLFAIGVFLCFWGLYPAFYFVGEYGVSMLHFSEAGSINLLLIMNGVGIPARLLLGHIADHYTGPMNMLIPAAIASTITVYCWVSVKSAGSLYAFATMYGLFAAGIQGLFPPTLASLTTDLSKTGVRIGMVFTCISFASLTGSPIAGALITKGGGSFLYGQLFAATSLAAGVLTLIAARIAKTGFQLKKRM